jgi:hypothetical protein
VVEDFELTLLGIAAAMLDPDPLPDPPRGEPAVLPVPSNDNDEVGDEVREAA